MNSAVLIFQLVVLLFSVMIHEISHGAMALKLGDPTAKDAGRLTLNPLKHLDFFGSFLLPLTLLLFSGGNFILGWAKPVPYNPAYLKNPRKGAGLIGLAGPLSNFAIAVAFGLLIRLISYFNSPPALTALVFPFSAIVILNVLLGVFNLLPLPPLDGSNILFSILPDRFLAIRYFLQRYGFFLLILFIFFGFQLIAPIIDFIYKLIVGNSVSSFFSGGLDKF